MPNDNYFTALNSRLDSPEFIPGLRPLGDGAATSLFTINESFSSESSFKVSKVILVGVGLAATFMPSARVYFDSVAEEVDSNKISYVLVDGTPRYIPSENSNTVVIPFSEHASLVSTALGLGKSDIARILGISRPTLYSWIKGDTEPKEKDHAERLQILGELTREICQESSRPLYHRFVEEPLPDQDDSILNLLLAETWDQGRLQDLLTDARRLTMERDRRLGHDIPISVNKARQESNLLDNSTASHLG